MPKPVRNKGTDTESLIPWAQQHSPALLAEFDKGYEDAPIIAGECRRCGAHVVEKNELHKFWHRSLNFAMWVYGSAYRELSSAITRLEDA